MCKRNKKNTGLMLVEMIVALSILALMLVALAVTLEGYGSFNDYLMVRQRCTAAADAQISSIAVTGAPISESEVGRLWPNVKISVERADGKGQWQGLKLITVLAEAKSRRKAVRVILSRYISASQER